MSAMTGRRGRRQAKSAKTGRRQLADLHVLRYVPGATAVHRCWAGTKILAISLLSIGLLLWPTWAAAGIGAALTLAAFLDARLPSGVFPRVPRWIFLIFVFGAILALISGGKPDAHLGTRIIGLGGLEVWARFLVIAVEVVALAALVGWTTPLADLAPALGRLGTPLRWIRVPIDELTGVIALGIRCLPLLLEEVRVLSAAWRTRHPEPLRGIQRRAEALEEILFTALASSLRRSRELAEAIEARGGSARATADTHRLARPDVGMLLLSAAAVVAMGLLR